MTDGRLRVTEMAAPGPPPGTQTTPVPLPSRQQVEQAVRHLDGKEFHDVYLHTTDPEAFLGICGGPDRYAVILTEHERFGLVDNTHDPSEATAEVMCGGQPSTFTRRHLVDLPTALLAAAHFLETAQAAPSLSWEWY